MDWLRRATAPSDAEVEHFLDGPDTEQVRRATEPLDAEVAAFQRFEPATPPSRTPALALALAALVVLGLAWSAWPTSRTWDHTGSAVLEVSSDGPDIRVVQSRGLAVYGVDPVAPSGHFRVQAGDVAVTVLGTVFLVDHRPRNVVVEVLEGRVQIDHPDGRAVLSHGERWQRVPSALPVAAIPPGDTHPERTVAGGEPSAAAIARAPLVAVPPPDRPGPAEFAALLARVEAGERSHALVNALDTFSTRSGDAALAREAEPLKLKVVADLWPPNAALALHDAWLKKHPSHPLHDTALERRANLARSGLKRCDLAIDSYRTLASRPSSPRAARAAAWQGLCAQSLGWPTEAREALDRALAMGVSGTLAEEVELARAELR